MDDALPAKIDIGRNSQFHFIFTFTCPLSKEEASDGNNMPIILPCEHVTSNQYVLSYGTGRHRVSRGPLLASRLGRAMARPNLIHAWKALSHGAYSLIPNSLMYVVGH